MLYKTPPLNIVDRAADGDHYTVGRAGPISCIVLHATGGVNSLGWLTTDSPPGREVSIHRLISKQGEIFKIVRDEDTAYHAGPSQAWQTTGNSSLNMNDVSLGIELENLDVAGDKYTPAQLGACARQIIEWWGKYGFLPVLMHYEIQANKKDPGFLPQAQLDKLIAVSLRDVL